MTETASDLPRMTQTPQEQDDHATPPPQRTGSAGLTIGGSTKRKALATVHSSSYPRKRAPTACQVCRRRKTKCDNARPTCGFCADIGATCTYQPAGQDSSSFDPASLALLERLDYVVSLLEAHPTSSVKSRFAATPISCECTSSPRLLTNAQDCSSSEPSQLLSYCNISCRLLQWPMLHDERFDVASESMFESEETTNSPSTHFARPRGVLEEDLPAHIRDFLTNVHTKNPVVEHKTLIKYAHDAAENGLSWDGPSCLVLIASALGVISRPFRRIPTSQQSEIEFDRTLADACYVAARKRIGLLSATSLLYLQCYFLSGVYEMYSLRALNAWRSFHFASTAMPLYLRSRNAGSASIETKDLEDRLYWSCLKSEFELSIELDLPLPSVIPEYSSTQDYPNPPRDTVEGPDQFPQEESWYYYLSEISQNRIMHRIMSTFYSNKNDKHLLEASIEPMTKIAMELELHESLTASRLPSWLLFVADDSTDRELPYFIRSRSLLVQDSLFQPFLFLAIHSTAPLPSVIYEFAQRCLEVCYAIIEHVNIQHRHHGSWFSARAAFRCGLSILAAEKSGKVVVRSDWRRLAETALDVVEFWSKEATDLERLADIFRTIYSEMPSSG